MKQVAFTICAKNYLAQAISLKESFLTKNNDSDFFIFLSDKNTEDVKTEVIELNNDWIPDWEDMAYKYGVVEFSTAIKPFCIQKLFREGYDKVIYLDPDIYVTSKLTYIWDLLDEKSAIITPHYCKMQVDYKGTTTEEELLFVGIFNLGFCALRNNEIGVNIANWWANRLRDKCYYDKEDALHVDQKWMDFLPAFYPNDVEVCRHPGVNTAIWNLHERELIYKEGHYSIKYTDEEKEYDLLFYHFSGFDPFNKSVFNRRLPKYNINDFPSFKPIIDEYVGAEYRNGYEHYSKLTYSYNNYDNGEKITRLQRRLYRTLTRDKKFSNPLSCSGEYYSLLKKNKLLANVSGNMYSKPSSSDYQKQGRLSSIIKKCLKQLERLFGVRRYSAFLDILKAVSRLENQEFLVSNKK